MKKSDKKPWYERMIAAAPESKEHSLSPVNSYSVLPTTPLPVLEEWGSTEEYAA